MADINQMDSARSGVAAGSAVLSGLLSTTAGWMSTQGAILSGMEAIWMDWVKRQQEAIDVSSRSLPKMWECRNPVEFVQTQQEWLCDAIERATVDVSAAAGHTATLTKKMADDFKTVPRMARVDGQRSGARPPAERVAAQ
jgi:hypothetical protein